jgi:hypothetical protein
MAARAFLSRIRPTPRHRDRQRPGASVRSERRKYVAAVPGIAATVLAAPTIAGARPHRRAAPQDAASAREPQYQETDHVRRFYKRLRT